MRMLSYQVNIDGPRLPIRIIFKVSAVVTMEVLFSVSDCALERNCGNNQVVLAIHIFKMY